MFENVDIFCISPAVPSAHSWFFSRSKGRLRLPNPCHASVRDETIVFYFGFKVERGAERGWTCCWFVLESSKLTFVVKLESDGTLTFLKPSPSPIGPSP